MKLEYNDTELEYEHIPIYASGNVLTGTKYYTKLYVLSNGGRYFIGEIDEKADEFTIKARVEELLNVYKERQYGTQRSIFRKELPKTRHKYNRGISGSIIHKR